MISTSTIGNRPESSTCLLARKTRRITLNRAHCIFGKSAKPPPRHEAPQTYPRGIFNFFGGIRRSTHPPSLFELRPVARRLWAAGRRVRPTHSSRDHARGLLLRRINSVEIHDQRPSD